MISERTRLYRRILVGVTLGLLVLLLWVARSALSPFIIGGILAYLLLPLVRRIERVWPERGFWGRARRPLAILLVYLATVGVVVITISLVVPPLSRQIGDIIDRAPELFTGARERSRQWLEQYHALVPDEIEASIDQAVTQFGAAIANGVRTVATGTLGWLLRTVNIILGLLVLPIWLFYVLKDERQGSAFFYSLFPPRVEGDARALVGIVNNVLGRYIRGQLFLGLVIGAASFIFLTIIGLPYALVLAVINGIFELIPIIGPWLGAIPTVIVTLALMPEKIGAVILFYIVLQQVENVLLVPKIQGDAVEVNPALLIIALVIGGEVGGIWGLLVAVPLTAVARDVFLYLYRRFSPPGEAETETPAPALPAAPVSAAAPPAAVPRDPR
jgi:predicted PurR-regulated permease PerM